MLCEPCKIELRRTGLRDCKVGWSNAVAARPGDSLRKRAATARFPTLGRRTATTTRASAWELFAQSRLVLRSWQRNPGGRYAETHQQHRANRAARTHPFRKALAGKSVHGAGQVREQIVPNLIRAPCQVNQLLNGPRAEEAFNLPRGADDSPHQGFSFHPRIKPIPKHQSAATSGFSRAYSVRYSMRSCPMSCWPDVIGNCSREIDFVREA
jgi:hypothetical protein